jgi:hypothetical protein
MSGDPNLPEIIRRGGRSSFGLRGRWGRRHDSRGSHSDLRVCLRVRRNRGRICDFGLQSSIPARLDFSRGGQRRADVTPRPDGGRSARYDRDFGDR